MLNHDFLKKYIGLQEDIMFDEVSTFGKYTICFSKGDTHAFWNNALIGSMLNEKEIEEVENKLRKLGRKPAFYFENKLELEPFRKLLLSKGYRKEGEDSAMFWDGRDLNTSGFSQVKKAKTEVGLDVFIKVFDQSYRKDDPRNPYGELGEYLDVARESWKKHHESGKVEYFVVYKNNVPVAVSTLTNHENIGYISNVGSVLGVRGEGYGKLATLYCVDQSRENGNKETFLLTEEGTNPNSFYDALGFKTRFTVLLMVK